MAFRECSVPRTPPSSALTGTMPGELRPTRCVLRFGRQSAFDNGPRARQLNAVGERSRSGQGDCTRSAMSPACAQMFKQLTRSNLLDACRRSSPLDAFRSHRTRWRAQPTSVDRFRSTVTFNQAAIRGTSPILASRSHDFALPSNNAMLAGASLAGRRAGIAEALKKLLAHLSRRGDYIDLPMFCHARSVKHSRL